MTVLNDGEPYHVMPTVKGVPPIWPEAKPGDRVQIHNGNTIIEYEFANGRWWERSIAYVGPG